MRIGIYNPYLDDIGGGEKYFMTMAACLSQQHSVSIFWDHQRDIAAIQDRFQLDLENIKRVKNIFSPHVSMFERLNGTRKYDAIIVLSDGSIPLTLSNKLFLHIQQPLNVYPSNSIVSNFKKNRVTKVLYNSEFTKEKNHLLFPENKTAVIYPPVTQIHVNEKKHNIVLHVGRFRIMGNDNNDFKKQHIMLQSFKEMVDSGLKDWKFILAVGVSEKDKTAFLGLKEKAKGYPIEFMENVPFDKLSKLYSKAKIYWHASGYGENIIDHPELAEHFGISTVEAMSAGAVPVVINIGGQRESVIDGKNGYLWDSLDELKKKTLNIISDEILWSELSKQASIRAKDFSDEKFRNRILDFIH